MKTTKFLRDFAIIFIMVFIVSMIVSYLYNLIAHGKGTLEWETALRFGIIFGIVLPISLYISEKRNKSR